MKKFYLLAIVMLLNIAAYAQTITNVTVNNSPVCSGSLAHVTITASGLSGSYYYKISCAGFKDSILSSAPTVNLSVPVNNGANTIDVKLCDLSNAVLSASSITCPLTIANQSLYLASSDDSICEGQQVQLQLLAPFDSINFFVGNSGSTNTGDEDIVGVHINGFSNTSTCSTTGGPASNFLPASVLNSYSNYTSTAPPFPIVAGQQTNVTLDVSSCGNTAYGMGLAIFIDLNGNTTWDLPAERCATMSNATALAAPLFATHTLPLTVPLSANGGLVLMRIVMVESVSGISISPSSTYAYGETEDYLLNISGTNYTPNITNTWHQLGGGILGTTYTLNVAPTQTTTYFTVASGGNFCSDSMFTTITVANAIPGMSITTTTSPSSCPLAPDGSLVASLTPNNIPVTVTWANNSNLSGLSATTLTAGAYELTITDTLGNCIVVEDTVTALAQCADIVGSVVRDVNLNCTKDLGELNVVNQLITANPGAYTTLSNANGEYAFTGLPYGTYTVSAVQNLSAFKPICNTSVVSFTSIAQAADTVDFFDSAMFVNDYFATVYEACALANDTTQVDMTLGFGEANYNFPMTCTAYLKLGNIALFHHSVPAPTNISNDTLYFVATSSANNQYVHIFLNVNLLQYPLGTQLPYSAGLISFVGADAYANNNSTSDSIIVCASYDPNDKAVSPQGKLANGYIKKTDSIMQYLVRFQNTGNAPATKVVIVDTLDANLRPSTVQILDASHSYAVVLENGNVAKFVFDNINLPDSGTDYAGSQGYISYSIKQKSTNIAGNEITNTANIYFDNNPAIVTNTVLNTLYDPLQTSLGSVVNNSACNLTCGNGSISVNTSKGVQPYIHTLSPTCSTVVFSSGVFTNLAGGAYVVQVSDALGDELLLNATLQDPLMPTANVYMLTSGTQGPTAYVVASGGAAPYVTTWLPINYVGDTAYNLTAGTYTVITSDNGGCTTTNEIVITGLTEDIVKNIGALYVYPNPSNSSISIQGKQLLGEVVITNSLGAVVYRSNYSNALNASIDISFLQAGVYTIKTRNYPPASFVRTP